jgi:ferredoxin
MLGNKIRFSCFSGTGNTLLVVKEMTGVFEEAGISVTITGIDSHSSLSIDPGTTLGLAFPVAFQSTYPFIWKFIHNLPESNSTPVFMVDTMMCFSGAIVGPLRKVLQKKGYACIGAKEIIMPYNFLRKRINPKKDRKIIERGLIKARIFAESLLRSTARWGRLPFVSDALYAACGNRFILGAFMRSISRKLTFDRNKCTKCGLCVKLCPVNNISMDDAPCFGSSCELCMRCLSFCPTQAITIPGKELTQYRAVKANEIAV